MLFESNIKTSYSVLELSRDASKILSLEPNVDGALDSPTHNGTPDVHIKAEDALQETESQSRRWILLHRETSIAAYPWSAAIHIQGPTFWPQLLLQCRDNVPVSCRVSN